MDKNLTEENIKKMKKMRYDRLISEGSKPSEALHTIEAEQKKGVFQEIQMKPQSVSAQTFREKLQSGISKIKSEIPHTKKDVIKAIKATGKFVKEDIKEDFRKPTLQEIKAEYARVKAQAEAQKQINAIRRFRAGKSINRTQKEIKAARKHELALARLKYQTQAPARIQRPLPSMRPRRMVEMTDEDAFGMGDIFNTGGLLSGSNPFMGKRKNRNFLNDPNPFGL